MYELLYIPKINKVIGGLSVTLIWLNHKDGSKDQLDNFLTGWGRSIGGGYYGGAQYSWSPGPTNKTTAIGVGFFTPGGGASLVYSGI
ncbi:hypothetical protein [Chitinophaga silvisoli]|uniref:Uncharacterized protein n=1 Tax=Chitinophaga silvisoli TaxID=2291814 RepID=A0A3E1NMP8_9BACT|nr:hypothetical protein [Chitinophaga silvisoli]RFM29182.1 hypothetical protein DXN04_33975 [Chitinophaga silvisoli]